MENQKGEGMKIDKDLLELPLRNAREVFERQYLLDQIERFGSITDTATFIGMGRCALHKKLKLLGVRGRFEAGSTA